ncbi:rcc01693 family protein [Phreatobacter sp.]|uniref:rcc01693 family protein n=1 Tax=Phreatobacter sp. TaxID=1966341 RepID=UPI003F72133A
MTGQSARAPQPFPWEAVLRLALGVLGWSPESFWRATPRELAAALDGRFGRLTPPAGRTSLDRLMAAYPDIAATRKPS